MVKRFEYRNHLFEMEVEISKDVKANESNIWHLIITKGIGDNDYYNEKRVPDFGLENFIYSEEQRAIKFVDDKLGGFSVEDRLAKIGFK